jgi:hypothetical protein
MPAHNRNPFSQQPAFGDLWLTPKPPCSTVMRTSPVLAPAAQSKYQNPKSKNAGGWLFGSFRKISLLFA